MKELPDHQVKKKLLDLAKKYDNISKACQEMGVSRQHYYDVLALYSKGGVNALKGSGRHKPHLKKRFSKEVENMIIKIAKDQPELGQIRVAKVLNAKNVKISSGGVRCVWKRLNIDTLLKRQKLSKTKK